MKINPSAISNAKQAKALQLAQRLMERIDEAHDAVLELDQKERDFDKTEDRVVITGLDVGESNVLGMTTVLNESTATRSADGSHFKAKGFVPGFPWQISAKMERTENTDTVQYKQVLDGSVSGPGTTKITLDKASGDIDVRQYYLGIIPARLDI